MKLIEDNNKNMEVTFTSVRDFRKYLEQNKDFIHSNGSYATINKDEIYDSYEYNGYWTGVKTWSDFEDGVLVDGDNNLRDVLKKSLKANEEMLATKYDLHTEYKFDVKGLFFDVGMLMSGEPEAWLEEVEIEEEKQTFLFKINGAQLSDCSSEDMAKGSGRILAMASALEQMNISTQIEYSFISSGTSQKNYKALHKTTIIAKSYDDGLNFKSASIIMTPSFFRRGVFRIRELTRLDDLDSYGSTDRSDKSYIDPLDNVKLNQLEYKLFGGLLK